MAVEQKGMRKGSRNEYVPDDSREIEEETAENNNNNHYHYKHVKIMNKMSGSTYLRMIPVSQ